MTCAFRTIFFFLLLFFVKSGVLHAKEVQIRTATQSDAEVLYKLICELAEYERKDVSKLPLTKENLLQFGFGKNPYFYTELAEKDDEVIGYALYFYTFSAHQGFPVLYVEDLYVKPAFQKQGIGTLFFKRLAHLAREANCCRLEGHVFDWNTEAMDYYESLGCEFRRDLILVRLQREAYNRFSFRKGR